MTREECKNRILNGALVITVGAALGITAWQSRSDTASPSAGISSARFFTDVPSQTAVYATPVPSPAPIAAYRTRREESRGQECAALEQLAQSETVSEDIRRSAQEQLLLLVGRRETELAVEAALAGLGYPEGLCTVSEGNVTLILPKVPDAEEAQVLTELASQRSGLEKARVLLLTP